MQYTCYRVFSQGTQCYRSPSGINFRNKLAATNLHSFFSFCACSPRSRPEFYSFHENSRSRSGYLVFSAIIHRAEKQRTDGTIICQRHVTMRETIHPERALSNFAVHCLTCHSYRTPTLPTNFSHGVEYQRAEPRCLLYIERSRARTFLTGLEPCPSVQWRTL